VKPFYSGRIASKLLKKHTNLLTKNTAFEHKFHEVTRKMAKVTKWRTNTIPVAKNQTLFGQKQRI
jgi:ribosomal protein S17E